MQRTGRSIVFIILVAVLNIPLAVLAQTDLHALWDDRCGECHRHAGAFARSLEIVEGTLVGGHKREDLRTFLQHHYLAQGQIDAAYAMLLRQANTPQRFMKSCSGCHGSAAELARRSLTFRDGVVHGRMSGRPLGDFLVGHNGLTASDAKLFTETLERVADEVGAR